MFILDHDGKSPLYTQLYDQMKSSILAGKLPSDSKLLSVRELAAELSVSRNTVEGAYLELCAEGYIYSKPRSGYFVSALTPDALPLSPQRAMRRRVSLPEPKPKANIDFHPARLDPDAFPASLWRRCFLDSLRQGRGALAQYGEPQGERRLRSSIRLYLERSRGVACDPEQIVVCSGIQQSLDIIAQIQKEWRPAVALENPGFHLPRSIFRNHGFDTVPIAVGPGGLDLDALETSGASLVYVTPSHQFPTGCVMPIANRLRLIEWANIGDRFVIEDDYDSELRYHGKPIPSLQGLHPDGNIVYLGTFSKVLSPALRVSYLVLPYPLVSSYQRLFRDYACSVSLLEQTTLAEFMEQGHWDRHLRRMRTLYQKKHDATLRAVEAHFGSKAMVLGQGAGLHLVLELSGHELSEKELITRARSRGIELFPYSATLAEGSSGSRVILGFGGLRLDDIDRGVKLLSQAWS
ncbi:gntR family transcriptional regulator [Geoanaerobacter pelophilus]|uniref:GntR family transcriptional regulator n=1 Tax=Geoanaerobacter pelophilus TaxID=60036 RepID=A0ABQ0MLY8_9BACT|nr:PLP-dependent aminotransferase family protein [Geoanaerobacter pelophilus]GAW68100.1 gntR family transcriptional regulator [Geoanaerobacter pelophilus]